MTRESFLEPKFDTTYGVYGFGNGPMILAGMPYPRSVEQFDYLYHLGFENIVCLTDSKPNYDPGPLNLLASEELQDLVGGQVPCDPETEKSLICEVVDSVSAAIKSGEAVVIHCMGGTGRTGTVIGAMLKELGYWNGEVDKAMREVNKIRGRVAHGWPESPWQELLVRNWRRGR